MFYLRAAVTFENNQILQAELREGLDLLQGDLQILEGTACLLTNVYWSLKQHNVHGLPLL